MFRGGSVGLVYEIKGHTHIPHYQSKNRKLQLVAKDEGSISYQNKLWRHKMKIIIPMSGFGERFRRAGYVILIDGKPIIEHVEMFPGETDFIFICRGSFE